MGQTNSTESGVPPTDIQQRARTIAHYVRNASPPTVPVNPRPLVRMSQKAAATHPEYMWNILINAEGFDNLVRAVEKFLQHSKVHILLMIAAETWSDEFDSEAIERFSLRYLGEMDWDIDHTYRHAEQLATMLHDEFDLPGFRLDTALRRWWRIVNDVSHLSRRDRDGVDMARNTILAFIHDHGSRRVIECIETTHTDELGVPEALAAVREYDSQTGEMILYEPQDDHHNHHILSITLRDWLMGEGRLSFASGEEGIASSRVYWYERFGDEHFPRDAERSIEDVLAQAQSAQPGTPRWQTLGWDMVYAAALRHMDLFDIESLVERILEMMSSDQRRRWMGSENTLLMRGRRLQPTQALAAVIADHLIVEERREHGLELSLNCVPPGLRHDADVNKRIRESDGGGEEAPNESPTPKTGIRKTPTLNLDKKKKRPRKERQDDNHDVTPPEDPDKALEQKTTDSMYNELQEENIDLLVKQDESEQLIMVLMEDIQELQQQVDDEAHLQADDEAQPQWPRNCPICGVRLVDEEDEKAHMATHRDELNKCREKNGLKPYGTDLSPRRSRSRSKSRDGTPSTPSTPRSSPGDQTSPTAPKPAPPKRRPVPVPDSALSPGEAVGLGISFRPSGQSRDGDPSSPKVSQGSPKGQSAPADPRLAPKGRPKRGRQGSPSPGEEAVLGNTQGSPRKSNNGDPSSPKGSRRSPKIQSPPIDPRPAPKRQRPQRVTQGSSSPEGIMGLESSPPPRSSRGAHATPPTSPWEDMAVDDPFDPSAKSPSLELLGTSKKRKRSTSASNGSPPSKLTRKALAALDAATESLLADDDDELSSDIEVKPPPAPKLYGKRTRPSALTVFLNTKRLSPAKRTRR